MLTICPYLMYTQKFSSDTSLKHLGYTTNPAYTFNTKQEMYTKMLEMATENGICRVIVNMDKLVCVACENNHCEAIINGVYNNATGKYQIVRANLYHKCTSNLEMTTKCIYNYISKRTTLSTSNLMCRLSGMNYTIGFFEVYAFILFAQNNQLTTFTVSDIFSNIDFLIKTCISKYATEFERINPEFYVSKGEQWIYFDNVKCLQVLRPVREIKTYVFQHYILIIGVMFCPNDEPLISSVYLEINNSTSTLKNDALGRFIQEESKATSSIPFVYLTEFNCDVIKILDLFQKDFFIKTRSLIQILPKIDRKQLEPIDYFLMLNYPVDDRQIELENLLNLPSDRFLRYCCKYNLWFLNNTKSVEFDFICDETCQLDYFDFHITLSCYIKWDIKSRMPEYDESILADTPLELLIENQINAHLSKNTSNHTVDSSGCTCSKYKEFGIPCKHFFEANASDFQSENIANTTNISFPRDPVLFASKYFQKYQLNNIPIITPLVQMNPFLFKNLKNKTKTMFLNK